MDDSWNSKFREYPSQFDNERKNYSSWKPVKKKNWKYIAKSFKRELQNYTENTTLHGFRYLSSEDVTLCGKLIWLTVCLVSFSLSIYLMLTTWNKYRITPTVTSVESTTHPIWGLRFPAVTICNYNQVYEPRAEPMSERMREYGLNETEIDEFFAALPKLIHEEYLRTDFSHALEVVERIGHGTESLMHRLMQPCHKLIVECHWLGVKHDCTKVFKTVKTSYGFCCAFNYHVIGGEFPPNSGGFDAKDQPTWNISTQPGVHEVQMVPGAGRDTGLEVVIDVEPQSYRSSIRPYVGASILIHDPFIYPEINIQTVIVQPAQEISVILRGNVIESEDNVRELSLKRRKCWFEDEVKLNTSTEYSYQACVTECRMEHIADHCRCLPFYYPRTMRDVNRCNLNDVQCLRSYKGFLSKLETPFDDDKLNDTDTKTYGVPRCLHCLPQCSAKAYTLETENAALGVNRYGNDESSNSKRPQHSVVAVFFPDITCLKYRRETFMTWDNLLASFGGIFGLCIGGSFVSFVEIIYYLLISFFRRKKMENFSRELSPIGCSDANEKLERQPVRLQKLQIQKLPINNWRNNGDFQSFADHYYSEIATRPIDFSHQRFNRTSFTIELSNRHAKLQPNFMRI